MDVTSASEIGGPFFVQAGKAREKMITRINLNVNVYLLLPSPARGERLG
jgi:hypothetical protein